MKLRHHGIKGQQWGVRHGPPYPINPKNPGPITIKKGTTFKRLSVHQENMSKGHAYVNYLRKDSHHYRGFFAARLRATNKGATVYSIELKAAKDLKAPSKQKRMEVFLDMYKKDPILRKELGRYHKSDYHKFTPLPRIFYEKKFGNLSKEEQRTKGYDTFIRSIGGNEYTRSKYFKRLADEGYSFVTDDMDAGRFGKEPSIVFDREKDLTYIGQTPISTKEMMGIWNKEGTYMKGLR